MDYLIKFRFWLHFSDRFGTKRNSFSCQINQKSVITIKIRVGLTRIRKKFSYSIRCNNNRNIFPKNDMFKPVIVIIANWHIFPCRYFDRRKSLSLSKYLQKKSFHQNCFEYNLKSTCLTKYFCEGTRERKRSLLRLVKLQRSSVELSERLVTLGNHGCPLSTILWNSSNIHDIEGLKALNTMVLRGFRWPSIDESFCSQACHLKTAGGTFPASSRWLSWQTWRHQDETRNHAGKKFTYKHDTFNRVIAILVNWHISAGILPRIARYLRQNTCWNKSNL